MPPAASFLHGVYNIIITQQFRQFGTPLTVMFPCGACELAYSNGSDPLLYRIWSPLDAAVTPRFLSGDAAK